MASITELEQQVKEDDEILDVPIYKRNGEPYLGPDEKVATIGVIGSESRKFKADRERAVRKLSRSGREVSSLEMRIAGAACAVKRWHGWMDGEEAADLTPENLKRVLTVEHILQQVEAGIDRRAVFFDGES